MEEQPAAIKENNNDISDITMIDYNDNNTEQQHTSPVFSTTPPEEDKDLNMDEIPTLLDEGRPQNSGPLVRGKMVELINEYEETAEKVMTLLRENQVRYRRFLKDELNFDVNAAIAASGETSSTLHDKKHGPYECYYCGSKFRIMTTLMRHLKKHEQNELPAKLTYKPTSEDEPLAQGLRIVLVCQLGGCGLAFLDTESAYSHLADHFKFYAPVPSSSDINLYEASSPKYTMEVLQYFSKPYNQKLVFKNDLPLSFYRSPHTQLYMKGFAVTCVLKCEFCEFIFTDCSRLLRHESYHSPCRPFECFHCEIYFTSIKDVTLHWQGDCVFMRDDYIKLQHFRFFVCNICQKMLPTLEALQDHRQQTSHFFPRFNYNDPTRVAAACELCGQMFYKSAHLCAHYDEKHYKPKKIQFLCEVCGKTHTKSSKSLEDEEEKLFECQTPDSN